MPEISTENTIKVTEEVVGILKVDTPATNLIVNEEAVKVLAVTRQGERGSQGIPGDTVVGPQGEPGIPGADGVSDDLHYVHVQNSPLATWTIIHNLNKYPSIMVVDSGNSVVIGEVTYIDGNSMSVHFSGAFGGKAYIN